jgi:hypothetical protein
MNSFRRIVLCALAASGLAAATACGAGSDNAPDTQMNPPPPSSSSETPQTMKETGEACPLAVSSVTSSVEDTVDGVVVVFATPRPGDVAELRRRVDKLADVHNSMQTSAPPDMSAAPPQGPGPRESTVGDESGGALDATATVEPKESEVRLVLRPKDPARLDTMRDGMRKRADELVQGACKQAGRKTDH